MDETKTDERPEPVRAGRFSGQKKVGLILVPIFLVWVLLAVPGVRNQQLELSLNQYVAATNYGQDHLAFDGAEYRMLVEDVGPWSTGYGEQVWFRHGWPFVHADRVLIDVDLREVGANDPAVVKNNTDFQSFLEGKAQLQGRWATGRSVSTEDGVPWMQRLNWSMESDWIRIHWLGLLANLVIAFVAFSSLMFAANFAARQFRFKLSLLHFLVLIIGAGGLLGVYSGRVADNQRMLELQKDQRYTFSGVINTKPGWLRRLVGDIGDTAFLEFRGVSIYWDSTMKEHWWRPILASESLQSVRVHTKFGEAPVFIPEEFFKRLARLPYLESLNFTECELETEYLRFLLQSDNLSHLQLNHCVILDSGLDYITRIPSLKSVNLTGCNIGVDRIKELRAARPELNISY